MEIDTDKLLENAIRDGLREGVKSKLSGYNSALDKLIAEGIASQSSKFRSLLESAIASCIDDPEFRDQIAGETRRSLAKVLVSRFGGELEKQVNALKSDPATRARITLAIEDIVKQK